MNVQAVDHFERRSVAAETEHPVEFFPGGFAAELKSVAGKIGNPDFEVRIGLPKPRLDPGEDLLSAAVPGDRVDDQHRPGISVHGS